MKILRKIFFTFILVSFASASFAETKIKVRNIFLNILIDPPCLNVSINYFF